MLRTTSKTLFGIINNFTNKSCITAIQKGSFSSAATSITSSSAIKHPKPAVKPISYENKVVMITGATAGIGLATTWRFAGTELQYFIVFYAHYIFNYSHLILFTFIYS